MQMLHNLHTYFMLAQTLSLGLTLVCVCVCEREGRGTLYHDGVATVVALGMEITLEPR